MASKHKQEDPWAGFVDVLSNILMVVIFLVVLLGMAIFALSQQITKTAVEQAVKAEREAQARADKEEEEAKAAAQTKAETQANVAAQAKADAPASPSTPASQAPPSEESSPPQGGTQQPAAPVSSQAPTSSDSTLTAEIGTAGVLKASRAKRAREADEIVGNTTLSVRSLTTDTKDIEIASEEVSPAPSDPVLAKAAQAFLSLKFSRGTFKIDGAATQEMQGFLRGKAEVGTGRIEIRAFAQSTVGSISEARRIAYYRAMQTRTELIKIGIDAARIELKIRESLAPEEMDIVRVFAKP